MQPHYWQDALNHLSQDKKMAGLIGRFPELILHRHGDAFITLLRSIVGQQISVYAADSIWARIEQNITPLKPDILLKSPVSSLKKLGLSTQKANYLRNIAEHFIDNNISKIYWQNRTFAEIKKELIDIKGIGPWTVEMFAIFYLLEPDIFPIKDLGLIRAINNLYSPQKAFKTDEIISLSRNWQPYRSVATWYLWRSIDTQIVVY